MGTVSANDTPRSGGGGTAKSVLNWCVANGVADDSATFLAALTAADGDEIYIPADAIVNLPSLVTYAGSVRVSGPGTIQHTRAGAIEIEPATTDLGTISSFSTVFSPVGYGYAETTQISLSSAPSASLVRGSIVLITSNDGLTEYAGAYRGELARVQSISGSDVILSGLIELTYSTSPKCTLLDESVVVDIATNFNNPNYLTEDDGLAQPTIHLKGCVRPHLRPKMLGQANAAIQLLACWAGVIDAEIHNGRNNHTDSSYGYGLLFSGSTAYCDVKIITSNCRNAVNGGANSGSSSIQIIKGVARHNCVHNSISYDSLSAAFGTHVSMYHTRFVDCYAYKSIGNVDYPAGGTTLRDFLDNGAGTQFVNCVSANHGGVDLSGATTNRDGAAGKYTTRLINYTSDQPLAGSRISVGAGYNSTVAGYHEVEILGGSVRQGYMEVISSAPRVLIDGLNMREQAQSLSLGSNNFVVARNFRRRANNTLTNLIVGPGTTLLLESYVGEGTAFSNNTLVYASGGAGTATVKLGTVLTPRNLPTEIAKSDGTTTLSASLLGPPMRAIAKGATGSRPTLGAFEIGQQYLDTTLDADGKVIWWNGTAWVDATGATV